MNIADRLRRLAGELGLPGHVPELPVDCGQELLVAYTKIFLGIGHVSAPPYGSVYLDGEGQVQGPSTLQVERIYAEAGLQIDKEASELPDHAAIELEFSAFLLDEAAGCEDEESRAALLHRHEQFEGTFLRPWLPEFGQRIIDAGVHPFYTGIGCLLKALPQVAGGREGNV